MGQKPRIKKLLLGLSLMGVMTLAGIFVTNVPTEARAALNKNKSTSAQTTAEKFAALSGFEPGADVSYQIIEADGKTFTGQAKVNADGLVNLPLPSGLNPKNSKLTYKFTINESEKALSFNLLYDNTTGLLSLDGSGADEFADIALDLGDQSIKTKSDWAGVFEESGIELPRSTAAEKDKSYQIAFFSASASDASLAVENPAKVEVYYLAYGGGDPLGLLANRFSATYCGDGPEISYCDDDRVNDQNENIVNNLVEPLMLMAEEVVHSMMGNVGQIGRYFDAKEQLETQRDMQTLKAAAVKDYHPSEQMCRFGSFSRSLAKTEQKSVSDKIALNKALTDTYQNKDGTTTMSGKIGDMQNRLKQYREIYCDPHDNNGQLFLLCEHDQDKNIANSTPGNPAPGGLGAEESQRVNKDIDVARTLEYPLTLDIAFDDGDLTADETDVTALGRNLYWIDALKTLDQDSANDQAFDFRNGRRFTALNSVAHTTYANIVAMKAKSPPAAAGTTPGWAYMKTMLRELGMSDEDIEYMVGENPSYYAQMDVLTKKIYQSPNFYTNLYDKPVNVDRIIATLDAVSLMQQRDHYNASLRREMLSSAMITEGLQTEIQSLRANIEDMR